MALTVSDHGIGKGGLEEFHSFIMGHEEVEMVPIILPGGTLRHASIPGILLDHECVWVQDLTQDDLGVRRVIELIRQLSLEADQRPPPGRTSKDTSLTGAQEPSLQGAPPERFSFLRCTECQSRLREGSDGDHYELICPICSKVFAEEDVKRGSRKTASSAIEIEGGDTMLVIMGSLVYHLLLAGFAIAYLTWYRQAVWEVVARLRWSLLWLVPLVVCLIVRSRRNLAFSGKTDPFYYSANAVFHVSSIGLVCMLVFYGLIEHGAGKIVVGACVCAMVAYHYHLEVECRKIEARRSLGIPQHYFHYKTPILVPRTLYLIGGLVILEGIVGLFTR